MNQSPPYYPNTPPSPGQFYYPPQPPSAPSQKYSERALIVLSLVYGIGWIFCFIGEGVSGGQPNFLFNLGISLFFGILACILIMDWKGCVTLQGLIHWQKRKMVGRIMIGFLCFGVFPFLLAVYLFRTFRLYKNIPKGRSQGGLLSRRNRRPSVALVAGSLTALLVLIFSSIGNVTANQSPSRTTVPVTPTNNVTQVTKAIPKTNTSKPTPTPLPTKAPTAIATPRQQPAQASTQPKPAPKPKIFLTFTGASAVDYKYGTVSIHTQPGASLTITVTYCSGHKAVSDSLQGTSYADAGGNHTWTWTPETKCKGNATADVTANWNGQFIEQADNFTVQ